ncbi:thioredoxin domain-containing protein [Roseivirga sp.]|uniref:thioredoxin domain-containing protein n=1 Tax=Roseivirga sp. TaxID=1964215 RepID=UPI003B8CC329
MKTINSFLLIGILLFAYGCSADGKKILPKNRLASESSLYLLQHSTNPIDWFPWGNEAFDKAKNENKLVVISIGYYACHWCQVMEKETFMDTTVAKLMNDNYVSIKVDREERPDIDQVYAEAARKMTGSSGWPLNIVATADGTPLFAGTYFENSDWQAVLQRADYLFKENPEEILSQANVLAESLKAQSGIKGEGIDLDLSEFEALWLSQSDTIVGGIKGTQKFPNSPYLSALLDYTFYKPSKDLDNFLRQTLNNMALGGMFDHLNGGFARYSTDEDWKVPHFEKMLYDNAQLMDVYAKAYRKYNDPFYLYIAESTANSLQTEFKNKNGGFYSSINAVSNEVEGGYYTWTLNEIESTDDSQKTIELFNITEAGNWENNQNVLFANGNSKADYLKWTKTSSKEDLLRKRSRRDAPPKDEKVITGWNALVIQGFVSLYKATQNIEYLQEADELASYLFQNHINSDGFLSRTNDQSQAGFLEDYAQLSASFITLYQVDFNLKWVEMAEQLTAKTVSLFTTDDSPLFKQSASTDQLFMASYPTLDSDLPSGNAQAAENLILLAELFYDSRSSWKDLAFSMIAAESNEISIAPAFTGKWIQSLMLLENPPYEVAILGERAKQFQAALDRSFRPDIIFLGGKSEGNVPLLANKLMEGRTMIYVCQNKTCKFPTEDLEQAYSMTLE